MFTGIIKAITEVQKSERKHGSLFLTLSVPSGWKVKAGDSIATNGVCLTVRSTTKKSWQAELMPETLKKSSFGKHVPRCVNPERSLKLTDRLEGHFVLGHVDTVGKVTAKKKQGRSTILFVKYPKEFSPLVAPKGSIAVDGVSLTIVDALRSRLSVALVDYTLKNTTLGSATIGTIVNLEFDVLAKYNRKAKVRSKK